MAEKKTYDISALEFELRDVRATTKAREQDETVSAARLTSMTKALQTAVEALSRESLLDGDDLVKNEVLLPESEAIQKQRTPPTDSSTNRTNKNRETITLATLAAQITAARVHETAEEAEFENL